MSYTDFDKKYIWHPFVLNNTQNDNIFFTKAKDSYLYDVNQKQYLDLFSAGYVNCHGYCNEKIAEVIYNQLKELDHISFINSAHLPAINLVKKLKTYLNESFTKFFFSNSESSSIEIALKMLYQFWKNKDIENKNIFVSLEGNYHGDTIGSMSLSTNNSTIFSKLMLNVKHIPCPNTWLNDENIEEKEEYTYNYAIEFVKKHHKNIIGFFIEPLLQCYKGMNMINKEFLNKISNLFRMYDIPVVYDEAVTGFGRTGTMFAYQQIGFIPDIICLSKALTGGVLPLALTITNENIYKTTCKNDSKFMHDHSYMANPLCCVAATKSLELFEENNTFEKIKMINKIHCEEIEKIKKYDFLEKFRICGVISAFNIKLTHWFKSELKNNLMFKLFEKGIILKPIDNVIYLFPNYSINEEDLRKSYITIVETIKEILNIDF